MESKILLFFILSLWIGISETASAQAKKVKSTEIGGIQWSGILNDSCANCISIKNKRNSPILDEYGFVKCAMENGDALNAQRDGKNVYIMGKVSQVEVVSGEITGNIKYFDMEKSDAIDSCKNFSQAMGSHWELPTVQTLKILENNYDSLPPKFKRDIEGRYFYSSSRSALDFVPGVLAFNGEEGKIELIGARGQNLVICVNKQADTL
jgi:hypothetical protein